MSPYLPDDLKRMARRKPYSLFKRPSTPKDQQKLKAAKERAKEQGIPWAQAKKKVRFDGYYYVQFWDAAEEKYTTAVTTGQTSEGAAHRVAMHMLESGVALSRDRSTFEGWAADWWIPGKCAYIKRKEGLGRSITRQHAANQRTLLDRHILKAPFATKKLRDITTSDIEDWITDLREKDDLTAATINRALSCLKTMLGEAARLGKIPADPAHAVERLTERSKERGILSPVEAYELLNPEAVKHWPDLRHYALNLLAASVGIRRGEAQALRRMDVQPGKIHVRHGWDNVYLTLKEPKTAGSIRTIYLHKYVSDTLHNWIAADDLCTGPEAFVFHDDGRCDRPMLPKAINAGLAHALDKIGIKEATRSKRNLTFHSWRHFANTMMRSAGIADSKVGAITGHKLPGIQGRYTQYGEADFEEVRQVQARIITPPKGKKSHKKVSQSGVSSDTAKD